MQLHVLASSCGPVVPLLMAVLLLCVPDVHAMPLIMPLQVFISDLALVVFGGILWRAGQAYGWAWLTCVYIIPYLVVCPAMRLFPPEMLGGLS